MSSAITRPLPYIIDWKDYHDDQPSTSLIFVAIMLRLVLAIANITVFWPNISSVAALAFSFFNVYKSTHYCIRKT